MDRSGGRPLTASHGGKRWAKTRGPTVRWQREWNHLVTLGGGTQWECDGDCAAEPNPGGGPRRRSVEVGLGPGSRSDRGESLGRSGAGFQRQE